jgi:hypothetical protein
MEVVITTITISIITWGLQKLGLWERCFNAGIWICSTLLGQFSYIFKGLLPTFNYGVMCLDVLWKFNVCTLNISGFITLCTYINISDFHALMWLFKYFPTTESHRLNGSTRLFQLGNGWKQYAFCRSVLEVGLSAGLVTSWMLAATSHTEGETDTWQRQAV